MEILFEKHSGELVILVVVILVMITLIALVPQLIRANVRKREMSHLENLKALDKGKRLHPEDDRARVAGRTALLVPMVVMISAGAVTCFLSASLREGLFTVVSAIWVVSGIVSLASITGGVALIGRLAQLQSDDQDEVVDHPLL